MSSTVEEGVGESMMTTTMRNPYIGSILDGTNSTSEHNDQQYVVWQEAGHLDGTEIHETV